MNRRSFLKVVAAGVAAVVGTQQKQPPVNQWPELEAAVAEADSRTALCKLIVGEDGISWIYADGSRLGGISAEKARLGVIEMDCEGCRIIGGKVIGDAFMHGFLESNSANEIANAVTQSL